MNNSNLEQAIELYNRNQRVFVETEALKIYCAAENKDVALKALEILMRMAQSL